ncbi:lantibiotic dehydratase [Kitasatospora sp. NPDC004669]|uniref:lantibiotic dehydratase n=1 Tax=Kitasatospora sp. NPDC004669 TaxID=3154555 RepID=UPI0033A62D6A
MSSRYMLRVAALPLESVARLRSPSLHSAAERLLAEEARLGTAGAALGERIGERIGGLTDDRQRRSLLTLRRQVFNNRLPADPDAALRLAAELGGNNRQLLTDWLSDRRRHADDLHAFPDGFARELARTRAELRTLAREGRLRLGLLLASPTLDGQLDAHLRAAEDAPDKRGRKLERSLLAYLYRTACKTSPFATFTSLSAGCFVPDETDEVTISQSWAGHTRLNVVVLARLAHVIAAGPRTRGDLPLAPASGLALGEGRIRYVRRSTAAGDDNRSVTFDSARDRVFFLRRSGVLERLLALFDDRPGLRCAEALEWLAEHTGAEHTEAEHYLTALLDLGVLQLPALTTEVHDPDPLHTFRTALRALDRPWADALADRLAGAQAWLADYPAATTAERRAILARLRSELLAAQEDLGTKTPSLPQVLVYEDTTTAATRARQDTWRRHAARPLDELSAVFPAFDPILPQRLTLKGFFTTRHGRGGRCEDLLTFVHDFHEDIFDRYLEYTAQPDGPADRELNWLGLPELNALDEAREEFTARMCELRGDTAEIHLDRALLDATAKRLTPVARGFEPRSYFLQLAHRPGADPLMVLNNSYGGLAFPFTRFTHCFETPGQENPSLAAELRESLRARQPGGAVFAEVTAGSATTNLNLHSPLTDYQIVCPGEIGTAHEEARLPLDDLYLEHDEAADRLVLRSRRLAREVVPIYFGYLIPEALPEVPRTLLLLSPTFQVRLDVWRGVPPGPAVDGVTTRPRVRYRSLVLQRRSWSADANALPARRSGATDADRYLDWQRWRRRHGLPAQVFARLHHERRSNTPGGEFGRGKPQYVDFASPLSLLALDGALGTGGAGVVFEELLPAADDLHVRSEHGYHVAEFAVETIPAPSPKDAR